LRGTEAEKVRAEIGGRGSKGKIKKLKGYPNSKVMVFSGESW